jgi:hypothetical protein
MPDHEHYTPEQLISALQHTKGRVYRAAAVLRCSPQTVRNYMARYPEVQAAVDQARGLRVDAAEDQLDRAVGLGEPWAIVLTLKTLGKDRGYSERTEHQHGFRGPLQVELVTYTDDRAPGGGH